MKIIGGDKIPKPPFIMISNHGTFFDPWLVGHFSKWPLSIMNNEDAFKAPPFINWYMRQIGTFPKKKGASDFKAMKETLKRIKLGYPVLIFPEGQTSWDGKLQPIYPGVEKIAKLAKASIVIMNLKGNFLSKPWWADFYRKGEVRVSWRVLKAKEIKEMSPDAILETILNEIKSDDLNDEKNRSVNFIGRDFAAGLNRFLWKCKKCGGDDTLEISLNKFSCVKCGASWSVDGHMVFKSTETGDTETLLDWSNWHKEQVKKSVEQADETTILCKNSKVIYSDIGPTGEFIPLSEGILKLSKEKLEFVSQNGKRSLSFNTKDITDYVCQRKDVFECRTNNTSYRFKITDKSAMKWIFFFRYLNEWDSCEKSGIIG